MAEQIFNGMHVHAWTRQHELWKGEQACDLPWAFYISTKYDDIDGATSAVQEAADSTGRESSIVLVKSGGVRVSGLKKLQKG